MEKWKLHAKLIGLENWSKQNLYIEENDIGQSCISTRWVVTKKLVDGETITKARLCARGFEETQEFRTDSPCCTTTGIRTALAVLTTNNWHLKAADVKIAFLQGKKINEKFIFIHLKKQLLIKFGNFKSVCMVLVMLVNIGTYESKKN